MSDNIRAIEKKDINALKKVIETSGLFPPELLEPMIGDYFGNPESIDIWLTTEDNGIPVAVLYCAPEKFTEGTYNLYLIAIHANYQGKGIGSKLIAYLENLLRSKGNRILIVETSGLPEFEMTRDFYYKNDYNCEAVIRDFYKHGEAKVVFWKDLNNV